MAEVGEFGGPSFGGDPDRDGPDFSGLSNAIAKNVLGVVDGQAVTNATPANLAAAASAINQAIGSASMNQGMLDFSGIKGIQKAIELGYGPQLGLLGITQAIPGATQTLNFSQAIANALGKKQGVPHLDEGYTTPAMQDKQSQREAIAAAVNAGKISPQEALAYGALVNYMDPKQGTIELDKFGNIVGYKEAVLPNVPGTSINLPGTSTSVTFGQQNISPFGIDTENINYNPYGWGVSYDPTKVSPVKDLIFGVDRTQQSPTIELQESKGWGYNPFDSTSYESIFDGVNVEAMDNAILSLDKAFASNYDNPAAYNQSVIDALGKVSANTAAISKAGGDPRQAVIQREIAQKAAEKLIAQEAARNNNIVNIPVAEGPPVNVKITKAPKRPTRGKEAANYIDPGPSPAQIAAASVVADQEKFKTLPKRIQQELRSGKQPTGSDYDVDRALALLKPPAPPPPRPGTLAWIEGGYGR